MPPRGVASYLLAAACSEDSKALFDDDDATWAHAAAHAEAEAVANVPREPSSTPHATDQDGGAYHSRPNEVATPDQQSIGLVAQQACCLRHKQAPMPILACKTQELRLMLQADDSLSVETVARLHDTFLAKCVVQRKGDLHQCQRMIRTFVTFRRSVGWEINISTQSLSHAALRSGVHWLFSDQVGRAVIVFNPRMLDVKKASVQRYQHMGMYLMEQATNCESVRDRGVVLLFDCRRLALSQLPSFSFEDVRRGTSMWLNCFPVRLKKVYIIGLSQAGRYVLSTLTLMLSRKLRARLEIAPEERISKELGAHCVPSQLGGAMEGFDWGSIVDGHLNEGRGFLDLTSRNAAAVME